MPRTTSLDDATLARVCEGLRLGLTHKLSAHYGGISEATFYNWKERGRKDLEAGEDTLFVAFLEETEKAEADCAAANMARIRKAAEKPHHWQAAAWVLERRFGFIRRDQHEVSGKDGEALEIVVKFPEAK